MGYNPKVKYLRNLGYGNIFNRYIFQVSFVLYYVRPFHSPYEVK